MHANKNDLNCIFMGENKSDPDIVKINNNSIFAAVL